MRFEPNSKYNGLPCAYVATGCAYEDIYKEDFAGAMIGNLKSDGWSTLENTNSYIRLTFPIKKKVYYKRKERITLKEFLKDNDKRCLVCIYGHFIYANGGDYWSFFDNEDDDVVCVWYVKEGELKSPQGFSINVVDK